jgi:uncharacterized membrane protein
MKIASWIYVALTTAAFFGMMDSSYVAFHASQGFLIPCGFAGGCDQVLNSAYARFLGISIAWFGLAFYLIITATSLFALFGYPEALRLSFIPAALAFPTTLYLFYLQAFVIRAFCDYCLLSASLVIVIFGLHLCARPWRSSGP